MLEDALKMIHYLRGKDWVSITDAKNDLGIEQNEIIDVILYLKKEEYVERKLRKGSASNSSNLNDIVFRLTDSAKKSTDQYFK